jgi:dUTP pyrophosphatase
MARFEKVSRFENIDLPMPSRKTSKSAGYDFVVAEDIEIPSIDELHERLVADQLISALGIIDTIVNASDEISLQEIANITKRVKAKPTLVSTGMKCKLDDDQYLELTVRSSTPLKHWLILANGIGIIDADYYNNPSNEGEIYFQLINLNPFPIKLHRGDIIGQGIIKKYELTEDDIAAGERTGGFGSTNA